MASLAVIDRKIDDLAATVNGINVTFEKHRTFCDDHVKEVARLANAVEGNGAPGIKADVVALKLKMRLVQWLGSSIAAAVLLIGVYLIVDRLT